MWCDFKMTLKVRNYRVKKYSYTYKFFNERLCCTQKGIKRKGMKEF